MGSMIRKPLIAFYAPWAQGHGTLGIRIGRFYADLYWGWSSWLPSGIFVNTGRSRFRIGLCRSNFLKIWDC